MDTEKPEPTDSTPTPPTETPGLPSTPQPETTVEPKKKRKVVMIVVLVLILAAAGAGYYLYNNHKTPTTTNTATSTQRTTTVSPYAGWKTYASASEKASFQYPSNWTVTKPSMVSNDSNNIDQTGIKSPSGAITISYVTQLVGFGDEHTPDYPLNTIINKTAIANAPGLYVVSGVTTVDGNTYYPWIAVQDGTGLVSSGVMGNVVTFTSHFAIGTGTDNFTSILFATSEARTNEGSPAMTKAKATAWFNTTEAKQAKLILSSLKDPANPAANWYLYVSPDNNYAMRIPDGWTLNQNCSGQYAQLEVYPNINGASSNPLATNPGTKATITNNCFGKDGNPALSVQWYNFSDPNDDAQKTLDSFSTSTNLQKQTSFQTDSGLTVDKYYMNVTQQPQNISQPQEGTYYEYIVKNSTGFVWIFNFYAPGQTDYHTNVEAAVKTLELN